MSLFILYVYPFLAWRTEEGYVSFQFLSFFIFLLYKLETVSSLVSRVVLVG